MTEQRLPQRVRVIESHVTSDPNPVRFRTGDTVGVGHHDQVWKAYVWGTDAAGRSGWVPDEYLEIDPRRPPGHGAARLRLDRADRGTQGDPRRPGRGRRLVPLPHADRHVRLGAGYVGRAGGAGRAELRGGPRGRRPRRPPAAPAARIAPEPHSVAAYVTTPAMWQYRTSVKCAGYQ